MKTLHDISKKILDKWSPDNKLFTYDVLKNENCSIFSVKYNHKDKYTLVFNEAGIAYIENKEGNYIIPNNSSGEYIPLIGGRVREIKNYYKRQEKSKETEYNRIVSEIEEEINFEDTSRMYGE